MRESAFHPPGLSGLTARHPDFEVARCEHPPNRFGPVNQHGHLNRNGPIYWSQGLQEEELGICCAGCNASRGTKRLADWFLSPYCLHIGINETTVADEVKQYLQTKAARD